MQRNRHSTAFREQALAKARDRGNRTLEAVAQEINISLGTLKRGLLSCPATWRQPSGALHSAYKPCAAPRYGWRRVGRMVPREGPL